MQRDGSCLFALLNDELQLVVSHLENPFCPAALAYLAMSCHALYQLLQLRLRNLHKSRKHADLVMRKMNNPASRHLDALCRLSFSSASMIKRDCESLASLFNAGWVRVRPLWIDDCPIGKPGEACLFATMRSHVLSQMTELVIRHSGIHLNALAEALPRMDSLQILNLQNNTAIGEAGVKRLANAVRHGALQRCTVLNLSKCNVTNQAVVSLVDAVRDTPGAFKILDTLRLDTSHKQTGGGCAFTAICSLMPTKLTALRVFSMREWSFVPQAAVADLSAMLKTNANAAPVLKHLYAFPATRRSRQNLPAWMAVFDARGMYVDGEVS